MGCLWALLEAFLQASHKRQSVMAEAIALGASIIAFIQVADRVIGLCKVYLELEAAGNAPVHLRAVLVETLAVKAILESLGFLISCDDGGSLLKQASLAADHGPIPECHRIVAELEALFPPDNLTPALPGVLARIKSQKVKAALTALAWPLKETKAKRLVEQLAGHKATISLALTTEVVYVKE